MIRRIFLLSAFSVCFLVTHAQDLKAVFNDYLNTYERSDANIKPRSNVKSLSVDDDRKQIRVECEGGFEDQFFTEKDVTRIYGEMYALLPSRYKGYELTIVTDRHDIRDLVPNALRSGQKDTSRLWKKNYTGQPWVQNLSRPYAAPDGLDGIHISLWQSHGRYFDKKTGTWQWMRPPLFCTREDLFSQTFVLPYILPMLENAGAVIYTPRERDWQQNEVTVDNDQPTDGGMYMESAAQKRAKHKWKMDAQEGFALRKWRFTKSENPFRGGTARMIETVNSEKNASTANWIPNIPESGRYAVYVSYQTHPNSVDDAHYIVYHRGGQTRFAVNQQMGGGTWVYLGTFEFEKGQHDDGLVVLTNESKHKGVVSADAVRFGGGMGNIIRSQDGEMIGNLSQLPRWAEAARYSAQWAGMPDSVYDCFEGEDDYKSDIQARPRTSNYLAGGSVYEPNQPGVRVPIELQMAFHTDAGIRRDDSFIGSLSICTTDFNDGLTDAGIDRYASRDLAQMLLGNLYQDLRKYNWKVRSVWNRNYGETRVPLVPGIILEMLSHQNFADMRLGYDPQFKFDFSRSVYKTVVRYIASMHQRPYVIQPLPVTDFSVTLDEQGSRALLTWQAQDDPNESTARPTHYIIYTRMGNGGFDNGTVVSSTNAAIPLQKDRLYSFRVCAANKGGQSFPSETLAACIASKNEGTVLMVNAFTRLSGPAAINTASVQGFDLDADPGVPYGAFAGYCGRQTGWDRSKMGIETAGGLGYSGDELCGQVIMGNTFDYPWLHGQGLLLNGKHSFCSTSLSMFLKGGVQNAANYRMVDVICGVQTDFRQALSDVLTQYLDRGGRVFISGANLFKTGGIRCKALHATQAGRLDSKQTDHVEGSGLAFDIYREMNSESYAIPLPETLAPTAGAFAMLAYSNGEPAAIAYDGKECKAITMGFPLEGIKQAKERNRLMSAIANFLCK
ncbi:MAG: xanthan lyase [Bacteroidaceae bacterium]|nr:xanthan lyase [Bacteroidaceae bacterium]